MFQETELSYISGNGKPKNLLIFQEVNFRAKKKKKKILICPELELSCISDKSLKIEKKKTKKQTNKQTRSYSL